MTKVSRPVAGLLALSLAATVLQGCYGNFSLVRKLYSWNGSLGDKWVNSLVMFALATLQVYTVATAVDYVVLNVVEFWTGSNPMSLKPGEREIRVVERDGKTYILTATRNRLDVAAAEGDPRTASLVFDPAAGAWFAESASGRIKLAEAVDVEAQVFDLLHPDGTRERVSLK